MRCRRSQGKRYFSYETVILHMLTLPKTFTHTYVHICIIVSATVRVNRYPDSRRKLIPTNKTMTNIVLKYNYPGDRGD